VKDHQLLDTARDYFQFVANFFEVINISATHIYHSALELSPLSSIVRKLYYSQRPNPSPRVVMGVEDSWDPSIVASTKCPPLSSTWSPCGQLVAVVTQEAIEIQDALSLKPLSTFHSSKAGTKFRQGLAYSPDGHSLAGCSETAIVIWDTQTGGIVTKIECEVTTDGLELIWSLDAKRICTISPRVRQALTIHVYDVASGTKWASSTLQSESKPWFWAHDESFKIVTTAKNNKGWTISIFEIGYTLTRIESFPFQFNSPPDGFSPTTYRASVVTFGRYLQDPKFIVLDIQNSEVLLEAKGNYSYSTFSPDASLLAAFTGRDHLLIWRYTSGHYTQWKEFQLTSMLLQFSPDLSLILGYRRAHLLHMLHLDYGTTAPPMELVAATSYRPRQAFSPHSAYIVTTHRGKDVITVTNLHPQTPFPSQLIKTEFKISEIVLTGNILLVKGPDAVTAWVLTEQGVVDGVFGNRMAVHSDSIWSVSPQDQDPDFWASLLEKGYNDHDFIEFSNSDGVAAIRYGRGFYSHIYHAETGEILELDKAHLHPKHTWYRFHNSKRDDCELYHHDLLKQHNHLEGNWPISESTLQEGWVKDPEGKHRLWVHPRWRSAGDNVGWLSKVSTLCFRDSSEHVVIKF
jgi:hypothetical protein